MLEAVIVVGLAYVGLGAFLNRCYLAFRPPPPALFPAEGHEVRSQAEGFTQRIVKIAGDRLWSRVTLDPNSPGPPAHVHAHFAERFHVTAGRVELEVAGELVSLGPGDEHLVSPGTRHAVRNRHPEVAVVEGPLQAEYALPRQFGLFLVQAYGFFDESPEHARPPRALLQMSFWSPLYDVWLPGLPVTLQRALFALVRPVALLLGYRPWYVRFAPGPPPPMSRAEPVESSG